MTAGMFPINQIPAVVLFDSGSSHSFMSQAFAQKHKQKITELGVEFRVSSAGADVKTRQMVQAITLDLDKWRFHLNLIVLPGLGVDVIIGMSWMSH